jgi:DNA-binding NarL/FixJ family response regulator
MIKVLVVEDMKLINQLISDSLESDPEIKVIGHASEGREAVRLCRELLPDLVLMDIGLPNGMSGIEATELIKAQFKRIKILVLTVFKDQRLEEALKKGADSYLLKGTDKNILIDYIKRTAAGEKLIDPTYDVKNRLDKYIKHYSLTNKQLEIFELLAKGKDCSEIAEILDKSEQNIKNHITQIYKKLGVKNIVSFMLFCAKENLL